MAKAPKKTDPQTPIEAGAAVLRKRRFAAEDRRDFKSLIVRIAVLALAVWVLFGQVFLLAQASLSLIHI